MGVRQLRILLVDDDRDVADALAGLLAIPGYDVCCAYSAMGALEIAGRFRPNVIILDINMPGMDGLETARQLKKDRRLQRVSFLAHSAADDPSIKQVAEQIGFRHFVTKGAPASGTAILEALSQIADGAG